jgi:hypothetical protein
MKADGVRDLAEYLERFALTIAVLQTPEAWNGWLTRWWWTPAPTAFAISR